jgi:8-oxo-dGTP pyrophosphatase MutT (NUDIX family)
MADKDSTPWPAIVAARQDPWARREPLKLNGEAVGSVARAAPNGLLRQLAPWLRHGPLGWRAEGTPAVLTERLAALNHTLRERGLITGWRDERLAVRPPDGSAAVASMERAAARFWGSLTIGVHANGYLADAAGRPTHLWVAERSPTKATDPGKLDNLVGGGVPLGQTPAEALVREAWEEAGLDAAVMGRASPGSVIELQRPLPDCAGLGWQWERLYTWDLKLDPAVQPCNQDGEVAALRLLPVLDAIALAEGDSMTVDAALVTLDFALRHRLLATPECERLRKALLPLQHGATPSFFASMRQPD